MDALNLASKRTRKPSCPWFCAGVVGLLAIFRHQSHQEFWKALGGVLFRVPFLGCFQREANRTPHHLAKESRHFGGGRPHFAGRISQKRRAMTGELAARPWRGIAACAKGGHWQLGLHILQQMPGATAGASERGSSSLKLLCFWEGN